MLLLFDVDTATSSRNAFRVAEEYRIEPHFARIMHLLMHIFLLGLLGFATVVCISGPFCVWLGVRWVHFFLTRGTLPVFLDLCTTEAEVCKKTRCDGQPSACLRDAGRTTREMPFR